MSWLYLIRLHGTAFAERTSKSFPLNPEWFAGYSVVAAVQRTAFLSICSRKYVVIRSFGSRAVIFDHKQYQNSSTCHFSTSIQPGRLRWEGSSHAILLNKLEVDLKNHQVDEAWESFTDFKKLYGFPEVSFVYMSITELSYAFNPHWLRKASDLVLLILNEKSDILHPDILTKLSLSLARSQIPSPATKILKSMLEKEVLPSMDILLLVVLHLVKTEIETHLASNFLVQICECFLRLSANKSNLAKLMKPDTMIFNLVLDACVRFKLSFKGQQMMELMPQTGVVDNAHSVVIISQIHEMNGQRDEIKKYKAYINQLSAPFICHYSQFYGSLLKLHFKFDDIGAATELVWDICRKYAWEAKALLKQMRKAGLAMNLSDEMVNDTALYMNQSSFSGKSDLADSFAQEMREEERAIPPMVIGLMEERGMYADKRMHRCEFLKLHKNLYRNLKASEARSDAQGNRLRYVLAFRKWAGIV
ncbi:hypothetical protein FNV43_RR08928 [Rhamnella rubrinervis]|uniref:At1g68980-like TPR repeats domain-containing protein n=1 Tax=Rhamnella rubrinervis TaxID=2594499 RepID=A0A8K0HA69_9ROSA|nr:hypothetical protein FNV43_RR08928 [Rhamnella rubrinervis]